MTTLNRVVVSAQVPQVPHVFGHIAEIPSFLHLLVGFVAIQLQSLKRSLPSKKTFSLSGESTQSETVEEGVGDPTGASVDATGASVDPTGAGVWGVLGATSS